MGLLACLMLFAAASPLNGQRAKSPSSKAQSDLGPSAASVRVAQPHEQRVTENDWREEITRNAIAPVIIIEFFDYQCHSASRQTLQSRKLSGTIPVDGLQNENLYKKIIEYQLAARK